MTSEKLKAILLDIYQPKVDFSIVLTDIRTDAAGNGCRILSAADRSWNQ